MSDLPALNVWVDKDVAQCITPLLPRPTEWPGWLVAFRAACLKSRVAFEQGQSKTHLLKVLAEGGDVARQSLLVSLIKCARLGLNPDPALQHFALIPYGKLIEGQVMYRGWLHLVMQEPMVEWVDADVIYRGEFDPKGLLIDPVTKRVNYSPNPLGRDNLKDDDIVGAFCSIKLRGRERLETTVLSRKDILKRKAKGSNGPAWREWFAGMCLAKAIKACCTTGRIPLSQGLRDRLQTDELEEEKVGQADVKVTTTPAAAPAAPASLPAPVQDGASLHFEMREKDPLPADNTRREQLLMCLDQEALSRGLDQKATDAVVRAAVPNWDGNYESLTAEQAEAAFDRMRSGGDA